VKTSRMNPIRSLLIVLLATSILCEDNLDGKESKNILVTSFLMIDNREIETFGQAVSSILQKTVNEFLIARIIIVGIYQFKREISEIMRISQGKLVIEVMSYGYFHEKLEELSRKSGQKYFYQIEICNGVCIFLVDSLEEYRGFKHNSIMKDHDPIILMRLIYVRGATAEQVFSVNKDKEYGITPDTSYELIIADANEFYDLIEMSRFVSGGECSQSSMTTINRFSKTSSEWKKPLQRLERREAFNDCPLEFAMPTHQATITKSRDGKEIFSGAFVDIIKLVAEIGKLKPQYTTMIIPETYHKDKGEGWAGNRYQREMIFTREFYTQRIKSYSHARMMEKELYFIVPQGELYTEWEKLFLAFDKPTWLLIVITFAAAFAVIIFISNFMSRRVQDFVFGENVTTPSLNVLIALFGLGQIVLPGRNFARFLLTMFIIWSLIIRTCYQGLLFEYMIGEGRKPAIKTFDELLERNFSYHTHESHCKNLLDVHLKGK